jgi:hypothetical protein
MDTLSAALARWIASVLSDAAATGEPMANAPPGTAPAIDPQSDPDGAPVKKPRRRGLEASDVLTSRNRS